MKGKNRKKWIFGWEILLFAAYLALLSYFLFFADRLERAYAERTYHYNLTLFKEIRRFWVYRETLGLGPVLLNLFGNVAAFLPFGVFLPRLFPKCRSLLLTSMFAFEFSLGVEVMQLLFKVGCFDVDDVFLNTVGGVLGFLIYWMFGRAWRIRPPGGKDGSEESL